MMTWVQEHRDLHDHSPCAFLERTFGLEFVDHVQDDQEWRACDQEQPNAAAASTRSIALIR